MAFLEKPFITATKASNSPDPVNYNLMATFTKSETPDSRNKKIAYYIIFYFGIASQEGQSVTWSYDDKSCRDSEYNEILAKISLPLGV